MRKYAFTLSDHATTGPQDLLRITPPTDKAFRVVEVHVTNSSVDTKEMQAFACYSASSPGGAGTAVTAAPLDPGDPAFGGTAVGGLASIATKVNTIDRQGALNTTGYHYVPAKFARPVISSMQHFVVRMESTASTSHDWNVYAVVVIDG